MHPNPVMQCVIDTIEQNHQCQQQISQLISRLIKTHNIQYGDQLRFHLGIAKRCDNFTAIEHWVNQNFTDIDITDFDSNFEQLENKFLQLMPEMQ